MRPGGAARRCWGVVVAMICASGLAGGASDPAPEVPFELVNELPRHTGTYHPRLLHWSLCPRVQRVRAVFPHPLLPHVVVVTTSTGVLKSTDAGRSWQALPALNVDQVSRVLHIAFSPPNPEEWWFATEEQGLWHSTDGGQTVARLAGKAEGLAADQVVEVHLYPADPTYNTLLALHGEAAPGLSRSRDGGKTWEVLATEFHAHRLLCFGAGSRRLYLVAAKRTAPEVRGLYYSPSLGQFWQQVLRDTLVTDLAREPNGRAVYVSTSDTGLYRVTGEGDDVQPLGHDEDEWSSAVVTWGPTADSQELLFYSPTGPGVVTSDPQAAAFAPQNQGLFQGRFVRQGAQLRANANGSVFFVAVNGMLYVGRNFSAFRVEEVKFTPPGFSLALSAFSRERWSLFDADLDELIKGTHARRAIPKLLGHFHDLEEALSGARFELSAKVVAGQVKPTVVSADLSRLGLSEREPLVDEGAHGDGAAGDGCYGLRQRLNHEPPRSGGEWRPTWPGVVPVTVSAALPDGKLLGAVGVLSVFIQPESFDFWNEGTGLQVSWPSGAVQGEIIHDPARAARGEYCLALTVGPGSWMAPLKLSSYTAYNVQGYHALSFLLRCEGRPDDELYVHLRDRPSMAYPAVTTPGVPLVAEKRIEGGQIDQQYRLVEVPLTRLLEGANDFRVDHFERLVLSGDSATQRTYYLDKIRFHLSPKDLETTRKEAQP